MEQWNLITIDSAFKLFVVFYLKKDTAVGVNVRPRVLRFSLFTQNVGRDLVNLGYQLEKWIVGQMLECKFSLTRIPRICLSQDSVAVSRNNL